MKRFPVAMALLFAMAAQVSAWESHAEITRLSLDAELYSSDRLMSESLLEFLEAERNGLPGLLADVEAELRSDYPEYPPLPPDLVFTGREASRDLVRAFGRAIRINPRSPCLAAQRPGYRSGRVYSVLEVIVSASDEPGRGMDEGLFTDKPSQLARDYELGRQPYGPLCPVATGTDAFCMNFMHEGDVVNIAVPSTKSTLAEYRFHMYTALARFAMSQGHPYWGYRFAGWGIYYIEELGNPYNASLMPGKSTVEILWARYIESSGQQERDLVLRANRKALLEDYLYEGLLNGPRTGQRAVMRQAIVGLGRFSGKWRYREGFLEDVVSKAGFDYAGRVDHFMRRYFPAQYVNDPNYNYIKQNSGSRRAYSPYRELNQDKPERARTFENFGAEILSSIGGNNRAYMAYVRNRRAVAGIRRVPLAISLAAYLAMIFSVAAVLVVITILGVHNKKKKKAAQAAAKAAAAAASASAAPSAAAGTVPEPAAASTQTAPPAGAPASGNKL